MNPERDARERGGGVSDSIGGYSVSAGICAQVDRSVTVDWVLWK